MFTQLAPVPVGHFAEQIIEGLEVGGTVEGDAPGQFHAHAAGQLFHRLGKAETVVLHEKADGAAVGAAPEAVVELLGRADIERGGLFVVKGTAGAKLAAGALERDALIDHVHHVHPGEEGVDELGGDLSAHTESVAERFSSAWP